MICTKRFLTVSLLFFTISSAAFADFNVTAFVNQFNNTGGHRINYASTSGELKIDILSGRPVDLSAYIKSNTSSGTADMAGTYFKSFCVEPVGATGLGYGVLNYNGGRSSVISNDSRYNGKTVNIGTAVLYSQFASGTLSGFPYSGFDELGNSRGTWAYELRHAIRATMGVEEEVLWRSNRYLSQLLDINSDQNYWMRVYDPGQYYSEVGDYAVFVMNVTTGAYGAGTQIQDFLYVTNVDYGNGSDVPEPATILLWSLGGLTFVGAKVRRRKTVK